MNAIIELLRGEANDPAITAPSRPGITHGELRAQTIALGRQVRAADIGPDDRLALVLPNGAAMAATFVGLASWCATAPLNPAYKPDEFAFYLEDLDARALVVAEGADSVAIEVARSRGIRVLRLRESRAAGAVHFNGIGEANAEPRDDDAIGLILHTSGTTSRPKMVPLNLANLAASARNVAATLHLAPDDRCLNIMPLFHIHGLMAPVLASLAAGGEVVCSPGFDALRFFSWLADTQPTWYSAVPTMHQAILARAGRNEEAVAGNRLRFIRSSSASLPTTVMASLEKVFGAPVIEAYAMTEAAHQMCSNPLPPAVRKPGSVGPAAGPDVAILDDQGQVLSVRVEGEIAIRGPNVTAGYLNNPEANATAFHGDWFRTGDQGVMDDDGYIRVTGRLKEIINRGGEKIAPLEVDEALLAHEAVAQACTFAMPHARLGEDVAAAVVLVDGAEVTDRDLRDFVAERLADFKTPRRFAFVDEIPKGPTGKIQRIGLAKALGIDS